MPINPEAVGVKGETVRTSWTSKDALLYAIGIGAGTEELQYTTENTTNLEQKVFPTFATIIGNGALPLEQIGSYDPLLTVHGTQGIEIFGEIPPDGTVETTSECTAIYDKGSAAVVEFGTVSTNVATGDVLLKTRISMFCRGEGGWGGERGPSVKIEFPERAPDKVLSYNTREDLPLIYRLSGDRNPLHSDPSIAALGGFEKPILHGLCTYGVTGRGLLHAVCDGDASRFNSMNAKFSKLVFPGDTLTVSIWQEGDLALFRTTNQKGEVVIDQGEFRHA